MLCLQIGCLGLLLARAPACIITAYCIHTFTELQLAALLGKSLLKRNNELEHNLRKLQEFAEETVCANQVRYRNRNKKYHIQCHVCVEYLYLYVMGY